MQIPPRAKKIWRRLVMELSTAWGSARHPEGPEQRRALGVQQDKRRVGMHTARWVRWGSPDAGQVWVNVGVHPQRFWCKADLGKGGSMAQAGGKNGE